ncbi:sialate O-acetylesterase [Alteromonas gilva]|uniref:Sialate O-acetylesterase n=1 Tax=Alteromonas gilva TaxID=2987522 RepID=A0ABT5L5J1_9ALTE|nr:sialate O-acetylesterase [Alteromonas gilva]MDC8832300.1 sialate O-acetylesterase [Alteromonas gilva]
MIRLILLCTCLFSISVGATTTLHRLIADNAILQRDKPIPLTGTSDTTTPIQVYLNEQLLGETSATNGEWKYELPAQQAGGPHQLTIKADNPLTVTNLYFGDVWFTSGQSNMELTMARVEEAYPLDVAEANYPLIREFTVPDTYRFDGENTDYENGHWRSATQQNIRQLSAVAYYFARQLYLDQNVPIGIVNASLGGSPIEAWMHKDILAPYPDKIAEGVYFADPAVDASTRKTDQERADKWYSELHQKDQGLAEKWYASDFNDSDWQTIMMPGNLPAKADGFTGVWWLRKTIHLDQVPDEPLILRLGRIVDADEAYINGQKVGSTGYQYPPRRYQVAPELLKAGENVIAVRITANKMQTGFVKDKTYFLGTDNARHSLIGEWRYKVATEVSPVAGSTFIRWKPMGLFNAMIAPATDFPVTGAVWYQGESNSSSPNDYAAKLSAMIKHWRTRWQQPDMPFFVIQLTNFMAQQRHPVDSNWAVLRDQQQQVSELPNTASIVTIDLGEWNDIHPVNKAAVAKRLALAARNIAYGQDVAYQGPIATKAQFNEGKTTVYFDNTVGGLTAASSLRRSFALAGADGQYYWARTVMNKESVTLYSDKVTEPVTVRYGWADNPEPGLYNRAALPAAPFTLSIENAEASN